MSIRKRKKIVDDQKNQLLNYFSYLNPKAHASRKLSNLKSKSSITKKRFRSLPAKQIKEKKSISILSFFKNGPNKEADHLSFLQLNVNTCLIQTSITSHVIKENLVTNTDKIATSSSSSSFSSTSENSKSEINLTSPIKKQKLLERNENQNLNGIENHLTLLESNETTFPLSSSVAKPLDLLHHSTQFIDSPSVNAHKTTCLLASSSSSIIAENDDTRLHNLFSSKSNLSTPRTCKMTDESKKQSFATKFPELLKDWHPDNPPPETLAPFAKIEITWKCYQCGKVWLQTLRARAHSRHPLPGCVECRKESKKQNNRASRKNARKIKVTTALKTKVPLKGRKLKDFPEKLAMFNEEKNNCLKSEVADVNAGHNGKNYWFTCPNPQNHCSFACEYTWRPFLYSFLRSEGSCCSYCSGHKCCVHNSFATLYPNILKQWDFEAKENLTLDPYTLGPYSNKQVIWKCEFKHCLEGCNKTFKTTINKRVCGVGCPACARFNGRVCVHTSIVTTHPIIMQEWSKNNTKNPELLGKGSKYQALWTCTICQNEWREKVYARIQSGRLGCTLHREYNRSKAEIKVMEVLKNLNHTLSLTFTPEKTFEDLRGERNMPLRYDYFVEEKRSQKPKIIETDGRLNHFYPKDPLHKITSHENWIATTQRDLRKEKYLQDHHYHLLRIPYTCSLKSYEKEITSFFQEVVEHEAKLTEKSYFKYINPELYQQLNEDRQRWNVSIE